LAIRAGHLEATKRLVDLGARVDDDRGPLSAAVGMRSPAIERLLLEARADPNLRTDEFSLLVSAFYLHDIDSAKLLLDHGADPDVRWDQSPVTRLDQPPLLATTPLIAAAVEGDAAFVRLLLDAGADPALRDWGNKTALDHAMDSGHREVIALLSEASRRSATRGTKPNTGRSHRIGQQ
jgi:ankyrin repeat protein